MPVQGTHMVGCPSGNSIPNQRWSRKFVARRSNRTMLRALQQAMIFAAAKMILFVTDADGLRGDQSPRSDGSQSRPGTINTIELNGSRRAARSPLQILGRAKSRRFFAQREALRSEGHVVR